MAKHSTNSNHALSASLSEELKQEHKVHNMVLREGDTAAILRGNFRDVEGKITKVDRQKGYVYIEGVTREKADGSTRQIPVHASKVVLRRLVLDDKRRKEILDRRAIQVQPKEEEKPKSRRRGKRAKPAPVKGPEKENEA